MLACAKCIEFLNAVVELHFCYHQIMDLDDKSGSPVI